MLLCDHVTPLFTSRRFPNGSFKRITDYHRGWSPSHGSFPFLEKTKTIFIAVITVVWVDQVKIKQPESRIFSVFERFIEAFILLKFYVLNSTANCLSFTEKFFRLVININDIGHGLPNGNS
ncbi:hypothetical protein EV281_1011180 [Rhizobium sp. BK418]|nr:hypothetical protein EV281_1011180 [Rhizobium sp. BK418]